MPGDRARGTKRTAQRRDPRRPRRRACDSCYKKKIQCDAEFPQCNWCKHHHLACTYNRIRGQTNISNQVTLPTPRENEGLMSGVDHSRPPAADPAWHWKLGNTFLDNVGYIGRHHIFSDEGRKWIGSRVGEPINFDKLFSLELQWLRPLRFSGDTTVSPPLRPELPGRPELERYITLYSTSFQALVFPVVSKSIFDNTLDLAYSPVRPRGSASAKSCVYSFLAIISLFGFDDATQGATDYLSYASAGQSFMAPVVEEMTMDGLQSLIMLVQIQYFSGDLQSAAVTLSIAIRLLYTLGAHLSPTSKTSVTALLAYDKRDTGCHLRDLFWLCYSFDKDICLRTGQPPCINDNHCDLTLPSGYVQLHDTNLPQSMPQIDDHTIPLFPWDLRLSMLKSQVYQDLYSAKSLHQSVPELLSNIRDLDEALEQWRLTVPAEFRPTLYFSPETPMSASVNTQAVMLRLAYYHCVTTVHQASSRCHTLGADSTGPRVDGITSSTRLAVTASRSTLSYLYRVLPVVKGECFWIVLYYAITAVLTLFCDIISNSRNPDVKYSVELLQSVPGLIRSIPVRKLTLAEVVHLQYLDGFTTELAGICMRALSRLQQEATKPDS